MTSHRILVPTDFSPASRLAGAWGATLARKLGGQLTLLHCLDLPEADWTSLDGLTPNIQEISARLLKAARERLQEEREAIPGTAGLEVNLRARSGMPAREILGEIRESPMDLVVVATHGRTGLAHALLGSVAEKLVRTCPCPLLTVKAGEEPPGEDVAGVLFPTDFSEGSLAALPSAVELVRRLGGTLTALHVMEEPRLSVGTVQEAFGVSPEDLQARFERRARKAVHELIEPRLPDGLPFRVELLGGKAHEEIVEEAARGPHDVVVMGTSGSSGLGEVLLGSTAERVVRTCTIPVMTVRAQETSAGR